MICRRLWFAITSIDIETEGEVPGIDNAKFQELAEAAKKGCPVSKALAGTQINLKATLESMAYSCAKDLWRSKD